MPHSKNPLERIKAVAKKEFLHILRDKATLIMVISMPIIQLIIYGYGLNNDVKHMRTVVYNEDQTPLSRRLVDAFVQTNYFDVAEYVQSSKEFRKAMDVRDAKAGLHIPINFAKDALSGRGGEVQLVIDGTDSNPANMAQNTSMAIVQNFMQKEGLVKVDVMPVDFRPRMWYNPDLKTSFFMVPGLVGLLLQVLIPMITAMAVVREKERGNLEQLLVTPIQPYEFILGKLIPYVCIGLVIATSIIVASNLLFHIPIRGNLITLSALTFLFLVVCLGIGLFASTVASNQQQASQIVMYLVPPSILLSGYIFPREGMPLPIYLLSYFIPLTYFVKIVRGIILKGVGLFDLMGQVIPLVIMAILVIGLSILKFRKRLS